MQMAQVIYGDACGMRMPAGGRRAYKCRLPVTAGEQ